MPLYAPGQVAYRLHQLGYTPPQIAAVLGNIQQESSFDPTTHTVTPRENSLGLFQWNGDRQKSFLKWAGDKGLDPKSPVTQTDYFDYESRNGERKAGDALRSAQSPEQANQAMKQYLRYGDNSYGTRQNYTQQFSQKLQSQQPQTASYSPDKNQSFGPLSDQSSRPSHYGGTLTMGDNQYTFGTGGGKNPSIPYGTYPITPNAVGPWGQSHGAIGINNNSIWDSQLGRMREGIELHATSGKTIDNILTSGCLGIPQEQWPQFKANLQSQIAQHGSLYLTVGPNGAKIEPYNGQPTTTPKEFIADAQAVPERQQPSIWDNPDTPKAQPSSLASLMNQGGASPAQAMPFSGQPTKPDLPSIITNGPPSVSQQPLSFAQTTPQNVYDSLAKPSEPPQPSFAQRFLGDGGTTPAQASVPPQASPQASPSFADRYAPSNGLFNNVMQGAVDAKPFQTAPARTFDQPVTPPPAQPTQVASQPSQPSMPMPQPRPDIGQSFRDAVNNFSDPFLSQNQGQLFNMQQAALSSGSAPWLNQGSNPVTNNQGLFGGLGGPFKDGVLGQNGLISQLSNPSPGGLTGPFKDGIFGQNGLFAQLLGNQPISSSVDPSSSFNISGSFNPSVPNSGADAIQQQASMVDPSMVQSGMQQGLSLNNIFSNLFGLNQSGFSPMDAMMGGGDMGSIGGLMDGGGMSPSSFDFVGLA